MTIDKVTADKSYVITTTEQIAVNMSYVVMTIDRVKVDKLTLEGQSKQQQSTIHTL